MMGGNASSWPAFPDRGAAVAPVSSMPMASAIWRRMEASWSSVMRDGVGRRRALEVVLTRWEAAQHGLAQLAGRKTRGNGRVR